MARNYVSPNAIASLKLLVAFAVTTVLSLFLAVNLHSPATLAAHNTPAPPPVATPTPKAVPAAPAPMATIPADGERKESQQRPPPVAAPTPSTPAQLAKLAPDKITMSPLLTPLQRGGGEPFEKLLQENLRTDVPKAMPLPMVYQAVLVEDDEYLRGLLLSGFSPNEMTPDGDTALCAAVRADRENALRLLLSKGANVEQPGREGQLPAALASLKRNRRLLEALLEGGANPNTKFIAPVSDEFLKTVVVDDLRRHLRSDRGVTILMACASRGDVEAAVTLMKHSASTEISTKRLNRYALDFAAEQQYLFLMRVLLGRPPDKEPDLMVTVNLTKQKAWIERNGKVIDSTIVSTGRDGHETPPGNYVVTDKHKEWTSTLYKASMPWFMRLNCSAVGLHAGYVTGHPASHGCIRLPPEKAKEWFKIVGVGDEVRIVE